MLSVKTLGDVSLAGQRVLIREDFNVPIKNGQVTSDARIRAALPSLRQLLSAGVSQVLIASHLGRPKDCLLYTSPSPRDISGSRMPSSA